MSKTTVSPHTMKFAQLIALLSLLLMAVWVYWPGLTGPLLLDDYGNLTPLGDGGGISNFKALLNFVFGNGSGPTGRPVAMLSFLIDSQNWPPQVSSLKYTNVMIHLFCGVLIFWLCIYLFEILTGSPDVSIWLALLVAALWLLHPLNVSTTLYVVQRMTQLMTLFALAAILCYVSARINLEVKPRKSHVLLVLSLFPFGLLAVLSKENGALLLLMIVIIETSFFRSKLKTLWFKYWYRLGVLLPLLIVLVYLLYDFSSAFADYESRVFGMGERLLTQFRVVSSYIFLIFLPNVNGLGVFHDDIQVSTNLFSPLSTFLSAIFILGTLAVGALCRKKAPVLSFAVFWFFGMHLLESTYLPLEMYFEHRNYMAMVGPLVALVWYGYRSVLSAKTEAVRKLVTSAFVLALCIVTWLTWQLTSMWGNTTELFAYWAIENPRSSRAQVTYADFLADNGSPTEGLERLRIAREHYPNEVTLLLHSWNMSCEYDLDAEVPLQNISRIDGLEYYRDDIVAQIRRMMENYFSGVCTFPPPLEMIALFDKIGTLHLMGGMRAVYHALYSDLNVSLGLIDPALIQLTKSFEAYPNPAVMIRQAAISASAGQFANALIFLQRAREAEAGSLKFGPSNLAEIERMEREFTRILQSE